MNEILKVEWMNKVKRDENDEYVPTKPVSVILARSIIHKTHN